MRTLIPVFVCALSTSALAAPLYQSTFDAATDVTGWTNFGAVTVSHGTNDADGSTLSGSLKGLNTSQNMTGANLAMGICVKGIAASTSYDYGARIFIPGKQVAGDGAVQLSFQPGTNCDGAQTQIAALTTSATGAWTSLRGSGTSPAGAQSVLLAINVASSTGSVAGFEVDADDIFLSATDADTAPKITSSDPPSATEGVAYTYDFTATGSPLLTFAMDDSKLPPGLTVTPTGHVSGTPTTTATYTLTVTASNGIEPDATKSITFSVNAPQDLAIVDLPLDLGPSDFGDDDMSSSPDLHVGIATDFALSVGPGKTSGGGGGCEMSPRAPITTFAGLLLLIVLVRLLRRRDER
jgi:hypothetical protein